MAGRSNRNWFSSTPITSPLVVPAPGTLELFFDATHFISLTPTSAATLTLAASGGGPVTVADLSGLILNGSGSSFIQLQNGMTLGSASGVGIKGVNFNGVVSKSANYTATANDDIIECTGGAAFTVTLPATGGAGLGKIYIVKNLTSPLATITVASAGNIDGAASVTLTTANSVLRVYWNGSTYHVW